MQSTTITPTPAIMCNPTGKNSAVYKAGKTVPVVKIAMANTYVQPVGCTRLWAVSMNRF